MCAEKRVPFRQSLSFWILIGIVIAAAGLLNVALNAPWSRSGPAAAPNPAAEPENGAETAAGAGEDERILEQARAEQRAVAQAQRAAARARAETLQAALDEGDALLVAWDTRMPALLTNEDGRFLAARPENIRSYLQLQEDETQAAIDEARHLLRTVRASFEALREPLEEADADPESLYVPSDSLLDQFAQSRKAVDRALRPVETAHRHLEQLVAAARAAGQQSDQSLEEAIAALQQQVARARAEAVQKAAEAAESEVRAAEALRAVEDIRYRDMLKDPVVQRMLSPFTTPTIWRPFDRDSQALDKQPFSFSDMQEYGVFKPTKEGLRRLLYLAEYSRDDPERPTWKFLRNRDFNWKTFDLHDLVPDPARRNEILQAQQLIQEMGPFLVREGLLRP